MSVIERRTNLTFCVLMQKSPAELLTMLRQAYNDTVIKISHIYDWHKPFHDRRDSVNGDTRRSCPSTSKMEHVSIVWERL